MLASNFNITLDRAADYSQAITCYGSGETPITVSASEFFGQVREVVGKKKVVDFTFQTPTPSSGEVLFRLSNESTKLLRNGVKYEYDIFRVTASATSRLVYGTLTVRANITNNESI